MKMLVLFVAQTTKFMLFNMFAYKEDVFYIIVLMMTKLLAKGKHTNFVSKSEQYTALDQRSI